MERWHEHQRELKEGGATWCLACLEYGHLPEVCPYEDPLFEQAFDRGEVETAEEWIHLKAIPSPQVDQETCLTGEEWCFAVGKVGHKPPDQPPPWQEVELLVPKKGRRGGAKKAKTQAPAPEREPRWCTMCIAYGHEDEDCPEQEPEDEEPERPAPEWEEPERPAPEWEEPERPAPEWEEPERPAPEWEEPERPAPEWEEPERPAPEWEEPERPAPEWEEPERPAPEWEEPERPAPEWEEPERPAPEWEEPERPAPEWEEPERPAPEWEILRLSGRSLNPKREESVRPQPKKEELVRPQPKEGGVCASKALGPKLPAERECLLGPCPPAEDEYLLVLPQPPWEDCLPLPPPPAEGPPTCRHCWPMNLGLLIPRTPRRHLLPGLRSLSGQQANQLFGGLVCLLEAQQNFVHRWTKHMTWCDRGIQKGGLVPIRHLCLGEPKLPSSCDRCCEASAKRLSIVSGQLQQMVSDQVQLL
ncbi:UNVERIFIED_CONTAM: hypothetical protein FKN15_077219 [Acipenser sinensis]